MKKPPLPRVVWGFVRLGDVEWAFNIKDPTAKKRFDDMIQSLENTPIAKAMRRGRDIIDVRSGKFISY